MSLVPNISVDQFDGLRLSVPSALVGDDGALDLLDVDWDAQGVLGSRMGAVKLTTLDPGANYDVIFGAGVSFAPLGEDFSLLARRGELLVKINEEGKEEGGTLAVSTGRLNFTQMGLGTLTPITYIANQNEPVRKFDGENFSDIEAVVDGVGGKVMPRGHFVDDWQDGANRLVVANTTLEGGPDGASGSPAHVFFSEPGEPERFESTAFVELNPGDGQQIIGMVTWGRQIFVFKERQMFVFYGIDEDEEGRPDFLFHTVDLGTRALAQRGAGSPNVIAGREGVYFLAEDGVWVTTGGFPVKVTESLDLSPNRRDARVELGGIAFPDWQQAKGLAYLNNCLFVGIPEESGEGLTPVKRMFKVDLSSGKVTYWKTDLLGFTVWASSFEGTPRLFFSGAGDNEGVYFYTPAADTDPTVVMEPRWDSGSYDAGDPDEKTYTGMKVWGTGEVDIAVAEDYEDFSEAKTFVLGAGAAIAQAQHQRGQTATLLRHRISGDAPWSVQRLTRFMQDSRVPGTEKGAQ